LSISLFLIPYPPNLWQSASSDFRIEPPELQEALVESWHDVLFHSPPQDSTYLLRWELNHKEGPSKLMGLQTGQQVLSLRMDEYTYEFIHWYRSFIHEEYPIYLLCSSYHESDYIQIKDETTEEEIDSYVMRGS
jgi:hypothetical protein